jgi:putative membrane protein
VKAAHLIFVMFWIAGMFMLPRYLVYQHAAAPGSPDEALWSERTAKLRGIIITPSMALVWILGLSLAFNIGFAGQHWFWVKLVIVIAFSGFHGWLVGLSKKMARGERPVSERSLRMLNEVTTLVVLAVVPLAVAKPF